MVFRENVFCCYTLYSNKLIKLINVNSIISCMKHHINEHGLNEVK